MKREPVRWLRPLVYPPQSGETAACLSTVNRRHSPAIMGNCRDGSKIAHGVDAAAGVQEARVVVPFASSNAQRVQRMLVCGRKYGDNAAMRQKPELDQRSALAFSPAARFVPGVVLAGCLLAACSQPSDREGIEGTLVAYTARFDDGTSETHYALRTKDDERQLVFAEPPSRTLGDGALPDGALGNSVRVWGQTTDQSIEVERLELLSLGASTPAPDRG